MARRSAPPLPGTVFAVTTNSSTTYAITPQFVSLTGLPFTPTFTATNLIPGQTVGVTTSAVSGTTATATNVYLIPQTLGGTVSAISTSGSYTAYTLTLASGSAFASLSGATTVTVYTSTATAGREHQQHTPSAARSASTASSSTPARTFSMVAGCSPDGPPGI